MRRFASKSLIVSFQKIAVLTLVLSLLSVRAAFAAAGGIPGRPTPPPPPCISTGPIFEFPPGCYSCQVRNVGTTTLGTTIDIRNDENQSEQTTPPSQLLPGRTNLTSFCGGGFIAASCVVTTQGGTTDELADLAVVEQYAPGRPSQPNGIFVTSTSVSETEGKVFNSCAPSSGPAGVP